MLKLFQCTSSYIPYRTFSTSNRCHSKYLLDKLKEKLQKYRIPWEYLQVRRKLTESVANKFKFERVAALGPDFACLEWLMECGATCVDMTDGTSIKSQKEMREFIRSHGIDVKKKNLPLCDVKQLDSKQLNLLIKSDVLYKARWKNVPPVFIKSVDASDSMVADPGFQYFIECYQVEKVLLHFCDFFGDDAIKYLCSGRAAGTLKELEIIMNPNLSDVAFYYVGSLSALKRAHFYFNPYVINEQAAKKRVQFALPRCYISYPAVEYIGTGKEK